MVEVGQLNATYGRISNLKTLFDTRPDNRGEYSCLGGMEVLMEMTWVLCGIMPNEMRWMLNAKFSEKCNYVRKVEGLVEVDIPNTMLNETVISWSQWAWPFYLWRHCSKGRYKSLWLTTPPSHDDKCDQAQVCQWRPPPTPPPQLWDKQEPQLRRVKPGNISDGQV